MGQYASFQTPNHLKTPQTKLPADEENRTYDLEDEMGTVVQGEVVELDEKENETEPITIQVPVPWRGMPDEDTIHLSPDMDEDEWPFFYDEDLVREPVSRKRIVLWGFVSFLLILGILFALAFGIPWWKGSATISIVPVTTNASTAFPFQGRALPRISVSQEETVATTGVGRQSARSSTGELTLINTGSAPQTVEKNTLITGQDGIQVVTDKSVVVPVGNPVGEVQVYAHALQTGPSGNIAALDISGPCCMVGISAKNFSAFTGGQNESNYQAVSLSDLAKAKSDVQRMLTQEISQQYQGMLQGSEALAFPVSCQATTHESASDREQATHVTVSMTELCTGVAYDQTQLNTDATGRLLAAFPHYRLNGSLQTHFQEFGSTLQVQASANLAYSWSEEQAHELFALIAGKSKTQALALLEQQPGVASVFITISGRDENTLPGDPGNMQLVELYS